MTLAPDLSAGFVHNGRIVYALSYSLETPPPSSRQVIVWLTPSGDCQLPGIVHSEPGRRIVTTKPEEYIRIRGELHKVTSVSAYRFATLPE